MSEDQSAVSTKPFIPFLIYFMSLFLMFLKLTFILKSHLSIITDHAHLFTLGNVFDQSVAGLRDNDNDLEADQSEISTYWPFPGCHGY